MRSRKLEVRLSERICDDAYLNNLVKLFSRNNGKCEVDLLVELSEKVSIKVFSQPLRINGSSKLEEELTASGCQLRWIL